MTITDDLDKYVTRTSELALFESVLQRTDGARILSIQADSGTGKSILLRQFRRHCRTHPDRIPISLIDFKDFRDGSPLALVRLIMKNLSNLEFASFVQLERQQSRTS